MAAHRATQAYGIAEQAEEVFGGVSELGARVGDRWPLGEHVPPPFVRRVRDRCRVLEADLRMLRARLDIVLCDEADLRECTSGIAPIVRIEPRRTKKAA